MYYIVTKNDTNYLMHHGIKGQKWGVRRYQNYDGTRIDSKITNYSKLGGTIKKGAKLYRVDRSPDDSVYDNKKYVSTTISDHNKWFNYLGKAYAARGQDTYTIQYKTMEDIKVASEKEAGELFVKSIMNSSDIASTKAKVLNDTAYARRFLNYYANPDKPATPQEIASLNMAAQTETGREFAKLLMANGYGAVSDTHGKNVSDDPIILLDPYNKIKKTKVYKNQFN